MADRRLLIFHTVAKVLSFTRAAKALHMTQPAITSQVRQLEDELNTRLFDRNHNRISLTDAGRLVASHGEQILEQYARMEGEVRELTGSVSGVLLLGASTTIAEYVLPSVLGNFKSRYPDVEIRLRVSNTDGVVAMVERNDIDLGVVEGPVSNKKLAVEVNRIDRLVAVVPLGHPLASQRTATLEELVCYPYIAREEGSGTREVIAERLRSAGLDEADLNVTMELGSPESVKGAVEAGMGISILSYTTIAKELQLGTLVALNLSPPMERPFSFVHQKQKFRVRVMVEFLEFARIYCANESAVQTRL
ncbi:MAG: LysR family transcriptional regulator [Chromatiales bacterium]|jgi:DNA-binding transcriptional LysR family regulator|nr:LysR family transcriptional regulator [Chromatiales bacterium]